MFDLDLIQDTSSFGDVLFLMKKDFIYSENLNCFTFDTKNMK